MKSGIPDNDQMITSAARFLRERQQTKVADWAVHNPHAEPGGWGFSNINTNNPDCDDTAAVLKAIPRKLYPASWERGLSWLLSMQNSDGGFSAFEKMSIIRWSACCRWNRLRKLPSILQQAT